MANRNNGKSKARLKNWNNRTALLIACIVSLIAFSGCNHQEDEDLDENEPVFEEGIIERVSLFLDDLPGYFLNSIAIDNNQTIYYLTSDIDYDVFQWWMSNTIPHRYYLSRRVDETGKYEVIYDHFILDRRDETKMCFDKNNDLWILSMKAIYKVEGDSYKKIIQLSSYGGTLNSIAVDNDNNIWTGGYRTGLFKIDSKLKITHYASELPIDRWRSFPDLNNIHVDKNNNIWIAVWGAVLKISKDQWIVHNHNVSENVWCLSTDQNDHLWIGVGGFNEENQSLRRFDGVKWETINPKNEKNELVKGSVRHVVSDGQKIYVVAQHADVNYYPTGSIQSAMVTSNELLTFDGYDWNKIYDFHDEDYIIDLVVDHYRQTVWVAARIETFYPAIYNVPFH